MLRRILLMCVLVGGAAGVSDVNARDAKAELVRVTYPIGDMIFPNVDQTAFPERKAKKDAVPKRDAQAEAEALIRRITQSIAKNSWDARGGDGEIQFFAPGNALVVKQTLEVHKQIAKLLADARRELDVQVSIQTRIITSDPDNRLLKNVPVLTQSQKLGQPTKAFHDEQCKQAMTIDQIVYVSDKTVEDLLNRVQGVRRAHILQTPKVTLFDGQRAGLSTARAEVPVGMRCDFRPIVNVDRKMVRLSIDFELATKGAGSEGVLHREVVNAVGTFAIPDGQTMLWPLGATKEGKHLFLLVTPRIIVPEEEERIFLGVEPPIPGR